MRSRPTRLERLAVGFPRTIPALPVLAGWLLDIQNPFLKANHAGTVIQHLDLKPGMNVLDVGCGPGRLTIPMAQAVSSR